MALPSTSFFDEIQALTRADPTAATEGTPLADVRGFRVAVYANAGQTLTGGKLLAWLYDDGIDQWMRNPDLDLVISTTLGKRAQLFTDFIVDARIGGHRVLYAASGVTVSAGTTVNVRITKGD